MKKLLTVCSTLFVAGLAVAQTLPNTENYIESRTYLVPVTSTNPSAKQIHTVQYMDGLGRPKQVVSVKASPAQKDVVVPIEYDQWGRQVRDYLPVPQSGTQNGQIYTSPLANAAAVYGPEKIYAEKVLEASPLNRIQQQKQVGNAWSNHPVVFGYGANSASEVKKFTTATTWANDATSSVLTVSGTYGPNQLYKNTVTDEDGNVSVEFKNGQGQTLLVRKHDGSQNVDTYYVYNEYDQLAFVISPLAAAKASLTTTDLDELCYQYRYDGRNRLVEKKLPGKGWEYLVYDKADRLVLTQDANLQQQGKWLITKYDAFGRVAYTGILPGGNRISMQNQITSLVITESKDPAGFTKNGMQVYYTNDYFTNIQTVLSVNYYDTYPAGTPSAPGTVLQQPVLTQDAQNSNISTKSLPTASYVKNIEDDNWTKTYLWYDTKGRPVGSHSINHLGGYTKTESKLDFAGTVTQAKTFHKRLDSDSETVITENFTYDHQNRLLSQTHQVNSNAPESLAVNTYNELSQLQQKVVGSTLQTVDYTYNIRGWMTGINDPNNLAGDLFGYKIKYTDPVYGTLAEGKYNGNIAEVDWQTSQDGILKRYSYQYDNLNRLMKGSYAEPNATVPQNGFYNEQLLYDLNGNIQSLKRNRNTQYAGAQLIDDLLYNYNGNRLNTVVDISSNYIGYPGDSGNIISYDSNGNMVDHADKGLLQINYNHLNLPNYIQFNQYVIRNNPFFGGSETVFRNMNISYRADGVKLRKVHNYFTGRSQEDAKLTTDYLDGFHYTFFKSVSPTIITDGLQFVPTSEGYFDFPQNKYIYQYKDQVGNVRVAFMNDGYGNAVIDRTTDFYPFGLDFGGESNINTYSSISPNYLYGFQEQERQQETGWDSFKWRNYDASMGRFFNVDPLAEKYNTWTPYAFSGNRVIDARELEGLEPHSIHKNYKEASDNFGQQYNNLSIRMNGEIGTQFYKTTEGTYSYTRPISAGPGSGTVDPSNAEQIPKGTIKIGVGHTHGKEDEQPMIGGEIVNIIGQNLPSDYGEESGDIARSKASFKDNPNFEGDVVITPGGFSFIYGPKTQNGVVINRMKPTSNDLPKDISSKSNPKNNNTNTITPEVLPIGMEEDNFPSQ